MVLVVNGEGFDYELDTDLDIDLDIDLDTEFNGKEVGSDNDNEQTFIIVNGVQYDVSDLSELALLVFTVQGNLYEMSDKSISFKSWMIRFLERYIGTEGGIPMSDVYAIYKVIGVSSLKFKIEDFFAQIIKKIKEWWFEHITQPLSKTWWYDIKIPFMAWWNEHVDWEKTFYLDLGALGKWKLFTISAKGIAWVVGIILIIVLIAFLIYLGYTYSISYVGEKAIIKARD